jgi:uncharacterized protein YggT (Ycf19 family)
MKQSSRLAAGLVGLAIGLLLARLVALLFAARPDNAALALLLTLSAPLAAPFAALNRIADQPQFGARLDLAALAALAALLVVAAALHWLTLRRNRRRSTGVSSYAQSE